MGRGRGMGKNKNNTRRGHILEALGPRYGVGKGKRSWYISRGLNPICLLVKHPTQDKWAATHNCETDRESDFIYETPLAAVEAYEKRLREMGLL